ncbi:claspin-like isoform X2 [Tubulanus polymorphus]|uniref:claspin-like isoform X2 n=1 Tax=Tubulanus polymorphus TaxID=672921 RepID=UPI003DA3DD11
MDSSILNSDLFDAEIESDEDDGAAPGRPASEDNSTMVTEADVKNDKTADTADIDSDDEGEEENICRKRTIKRSVIIDDDDDDEDDDNSKDDMINSQNDNNDTAAAANEDDTEDKNEDESKADSDNEDTGDAENGSARNVRNESDSDDDNGNSGSNSDSNSEKSEDENEEEKIGRWTNSKGAGKTVKRDRPQQRAAAKRSMDEMKNIHSETQRMVREGELRLPYHQPKPRSLSEFLNRRKTNISVLRPTSTFIRQMSKDTPSKPPRRKNRSQNSPEESKLQKYRSQDSSEEIKIAAESIDEGVCDVKTQSQDSKNLHDKFGLDDSDDDEELPDLQITDLKINAIPENDDVSLNVERAIENELPATLDSGCLVNTQCAEIASVSQETDSDPAVESIDEKILTGNKLSVFNGADDFEETDLGTSAQSQRADNIKEPLTDIQLNTDPSPKSMKLWSKVKQDLSDDIINLKPCIGLAVADGDFIDFDSEGENDKPKSGVGLLREKLMRHSVKPCLKSPAQVKVHIVKKEIDEDNNKESLHMETMTVPLTVEKENDPALGKPGAKLGCLKVQLKKAMKLKREEALKKRMESYDMENEEGFDEEEAELTDQSDTDGEEEGEDDHMDDEEVEAEENNDNDEENPFADDEAVDDDDVDDAQSESEMNLKLDRSDEEDDEEEISKNAPKSTGSSSNKKLLSLNFSNLSEKIQGKYSEDSSLEEENLPDLIVVSDKRRASPTTPDMFTQFPNTQTPQTRQNEDSSFKIPPLLTLPIEDSQDLYSDTQSERSCNQVNLFIEESQSQLLDEDGFLKVPSSAKKQSKRQLNLAGLVDSSLKSPDASDELLGLCSGQFSVATGKSAFGLKNLVSGTQKQQDSMDELAGLCSGNFTSSMSTQKPTEKTKRPFDSTQNPDSLDELDGLCSGKFVPSSFGKSSQVEEEEADLEDDLDLRLKSDDEDGDVSDNEDQQDNLDSDEENNPKKRRYDDENEEEDEDDVLDEEFPPSFTGFKSKKKGKIRKEFLEQEAELSGSEAGSDEDLDLDEKDDVMEAEAGDADFVGSESHLRDQVGRVHLKSLIDEDKRQLRLMQEMYLPDGDLHSDGAGRQRRFAWKHLDDDLSQDMFDDDGNAELRDDDNENEIKWRKERFEREKWLAEQDDVAEESSQFLKLSSRILQKSLADKESKENSQKASGFRAQRKGSFLSRNKTTLAKIAEVTKPMANPGQAVNSRKFVFSALSPDVKTLEKKNLSRSNTVASTAQPPRKRLKLEHSKSANSIFNHF